MTVAPPLPHSPVSPASPASSDPSDLSALPALPATPPGRYRHYKGGEYEVLGSVRHSETLAPLVLYRALYGERGLWVRPHAMFFEAITIDGVQQPRFAPVASPPLKPEDAAPVMNQR